MDIFLLGRAESTVNGDFHTGPLAGPIFLWLPIALVAETRAKSAKAEPGEARFTMRLRSLVRHLGLPVEVGEWRWSCNPSSSLDSGLPAAAAAEHPKEADERDEDEAAGLGNGGCERRGDNWIVDTDRFALR